MNLGADIVRAILLAIALVALVVIVAPLAGCATQRQPELTTGVKTVTVTKAVPVPCVDPTDIPPEYATAMPDPGADAGRKAAGASVDVRTLVTQHRQMRALLVQCSTGGKP